MEAIVEELCNLGVAGYNFMDMRKKAKLLSWLVEQIYDLAIFRTCMSSMPDKHSELSKERNSLMEAKKEAENEISNIVKEIEDSTAAVAAIEADLEKEEGAQAPSSRRESYQLKMKSLQMKKKIDGLWSKKTKLEQSIENNQVAITNISLKIPFLYHPVKLLGRDRHRNKYYFFSEDPTKIFIEPTSEENSLLGTSNPSWRMIAHTKDLDDFLKKLNPYGLRENKLLNSISDLQNLKYMKLAEMDVEEDVEKALGDALEDLRNYSSMYQPSNGQRRPKTRSKTSSVNQPENFILKYFRQKFLTTPIITRVTVSFLVEIMLEIERELTILMASINCEWISPDGLQKWREDMNSNEIEAISRCLLTLTDSLSKLRKYRKKAKVDRRVVESIDESGEEEQDQDRSRESEEEDDEEYDEIDDSFANGRVFDPTLYTQCGKTAIFEFGFYRYKVKLAWKELVSTRHTASGLYLAVAAYVDTLAYYINKRALRIEEKQVAESGRVTWDYGRSMRSRYKALCNQNTSKLNTERPLSRKERLEIRHRASLV